MLSAKQAAALLSCLVLPAIARSRDTASDHASLYRCDADNIPTSWAVNNPPGLIEGNDVTFEDLGEGSVELRFRSQETTPIQALAIVVQYTDANGEVIDRVPLSAAAATNPPTNTPSNILSPSNQWKNILSQGEAANMLAVTNGIRTGRCPATALVTFAQLRFINGAVQTFASRGWQLGPQPTLIPSPGTVPFFPARLPAALAVTLKISSRGEVLDVVPMQPAESDVVNWIRDRMKIWKFHPALVNGKPVDSELETLFLVGSGNFTETKPVLQPITIIRFIPGKQNNKWAAMYGALNEFSSIEAAFGRFGLTR